MFRSNGAKILFFNVAAALVALAGYLLHATDNLHPVVRYFFYPLYGYVMLSFITAAIGIVMGMLEKERGMEPAKYGVWGNALYIVVLLAALAGIWMAHHPQS
ncbi:hypothetical protein [Hydrogenimonas urashimensis]|uniref:hypothetical protein n=1 Tax=Hydrogenimonas urashimensis TaxID=2740515 RepID=UPI001916C6A5|nr:hypothetical protein [Hydrogenimonas urashimensis]